MNPENPITVPVTDVTTIVLPSEINKVIVILEKWTTTPVPKPTLDYSEKWQNIIRLSEAFAKKNDLDDAGAESFYRRNASAQGRCAALDNVLCGPDSKCARTTVRTCVSVAVRRRRHPDGAGNFQNPLQVLLRSIARQHDTGRGTDKVALALRSSSRALCGQTLSVPPFWTGKARGALAGNIDKLGIFPAMAAGLLLWNNISNSVLASWALILVPLILLVHLMSLYVFSLQQKMDRVIAGLEFSLASLKG